MEPVICIRIGQAGVQVGIEFWKLLIKQHGIGRDGQVESEVKGFPESVFSEDDGRYSPRALF